MSDTYCSVCGKVVDELEDCNQEVCPFGMGDSLPEEMKELDFSEDKA